MNCTPYLDRVLDAVQSLFDNGDERECSILDVEAAREELRCMRELLSGKTMYDDRQHALDQALEAVRHSHEELVGKLKNLQRSHSGRNSE
jgi:hypothetical protein